MKNEELLIVLAKAAVFGRLLSDISGASRNFSGVYPQIFKGVFYEYC
jgi:hypothetical protein